MLKMPEPEVASKAFVEISRLDLDCFDPATASISEVKHLASYNWVEAPTPTIVVPGSPAQWSAPRGSRQVKKDSGFVYIAQNAARHPDSPLEPLFRSLYIEQPLFDIRSTDVVTDRNNIRKLLSFIKPTLTKHGFDPFTIHVEMADQTAIFCRDETATSEVIGPGEFRGYGHEFEKAYTIPIVQDSTGHHRIISYRLGGMGLLVRHETDGYVEDLTPVVKDDESTEDSLANILNSLSLSTENTATEETSIPSKLTIKRGGRVVPRESTLEIKTRVSHKPLDLSEIAPQVWASQTPKLVRAYHQRGKFSAPEVEDITTAVKNWENAHQHDIGKLVALINRILRVTRSWGGSSTIGYDIQKDKLVIKKTERNKMLPGDIYSRWAKRSPDVARKTTENSPALASKKTDARTNTSAVDQDEATQEGIMANPASLQHEENITTCAVGNESES